MSATENVKDDKAGGQHKAEETGIGAFKRSRTSPTAAMHKDLQNASVNESVAHFQSLLNAKVPAAISAQGPEPVPQVADPAAPNRVGEQSTRSPTQERFAPQAESVVRDTGLSNKTSKSSKEDEEEIKKEFPNDGRNTNFKWPNKLELAMDDYQHKLKQAGNRFAIRDLMILGLVEVLSIPKDQVMKKLNEALKGFGV